MGAAADTLGGVVGLPETGPLVEPVDRALVGLGVGLSAIGELVGSAKLDVGSLVGTSAVADGDDTDVGLWVG